MVIQSNQRRIEWIDVAKGYGIVMVVLGHLVNGKLELWFNSFHMALFFFLSGYVFSDKDDLSLFLKKKIKSLVIPYFCLGIPMLIFQIVLNKMNGVFSLESTLQLLKTFLMQNRVWTLWYIACVFFLCIFFYFIIKICKYNILVVAVSLLCGVIGLFYYKNGGKPLFWSIDVCFTAMPFYMAGYMFKRYGCYIDTKLSKKSTLFLLSIIFFVINIVLYIVSLDESGVGMIMAFMKYGNPFFSYPAAFAGVIMVICFAKALPLSLMKYLGENSMLYFAWHQTIVFPIVFAILKSVGFIISKNIFYLMSIFLTFAILTILDWIIKKMRLQFVLGK